MQRLRLLLLVNGIAAEVAFHGLYLWHYFDGAEWWRCNVPWSVEDIRVVLMGAYSTWNQ